MTARSTTNRSHLKRLSGSRLLDILSPSTKRTEPETQSNSGPQEDYLENQQDRLLLRVLKRIIFNTLIFTGIFHFLLPLSAAGREIGGVLLWTVLGILVSITALFRIFGNRLLCSNLLLLTLSTVLIGSSFVLGGAMSPTMICMLAIPVLATTLMNQFWASLWTGIAVVSWLSILVLEVSFVEMSRITIEENVAVVQVISLLVTGLIVVAVSGSYASTNSRMSLAMRQRNKRLDYLASHDALTGIYNRRAFHQQAEQALQRASRTGQPVAILLADLNDFKKINDSLGHAVGDEVLQHFAQRLKNSFRKTDIIGRLGGDEFAVVLEPIESPEVVNRALNRLSRVEDEDVFVTDGGELHYDYAVGYSTYPDNGCELAELMDSADAAMYTAKAERKPANSISTELEETDARTVRNFTVIGVEN